MTQRRSSNAQLFLETLEPRIAPAGLSDGDFQAAPVGSSILLTAGEGLSTSDTGGSYLLYVEKGQAVIFTTDLNANNKVDFNEITGIAAGDGLRLTSFVDINGDIVTNLNPNGRLTDSDGDASNGYDGKIVLNSRIESIVLRSLVDTDLNLDIAGNTVQNRLAKSSYSVNGNIYAGGGIGVTGAFGLQIDSSGFAQQALKYGGTQTIAGEGTPIPSVGFILTGSATGGEYFSFGTSPVWGDGPAESLRGQLTKFLPAASQAGGDVTGIRAGTSAIIDPDTGEETFQPSTYYFGGIKTGDGGFGARGGNISAVQIEGDIGGLLLQTGHGGDGVTGGNGGSITGLTINNSVNSAVQIVTGDGGAGLIGAAGRAGNVQFDGTAELMGRISVGLGKGGDALGNGGAGTSLDNMSFVDVRPGTYLPAGIVTTWRMAGDIGDAAPIFGPGNVVTGYSTRNFDFDRDGFDDAVMLTDVPDQTVVAFGSRDPATTGTFDPTRSIYLPSMSYAAATERTSALVVLDANGDGLPDIVSGQSTGDGFNGIVTHLNRGPDPLTGAWLGFALPRYSPLPDGGSLRNTPLAIINLVAGDFDRDGAMDLGVMSMGLTSDTLPPYFAALTVMSGLKGGDGVADGFFAADYGKGAGTTPTKTPVFSFGRSSEANFSFVMRATASEAGNAASDLIGIVSRGGETGPSVTATVDRGRSLGIFSIDPATSALSGALSALQYTERVLDGDPRTWVGYGTDFGVRAADFLFLDVDNDGAFDAVAVGTPTGDRAPSYLVAATLQGTAAGAIAQNAQVDPGGIAYPGGVTPGGLYFGVALSESRDPVVASVLNNDREDVIVLRMVAGDFDNDPTTANFALSAIDLVSVNDPPATQARLFTVRGFGQYNGEFDVTGTTPTYTPVGEEAFRDSFFGYYSQAPDLSVGQTNELAPDETFWGLVSPGANPSALWFPLAASNLSLTAGGGGWSLLGIGGAGGSIGSGVLNADELAAWAGGNSAARPGTINAWGQVSQIFRSGFGGFGLLGGGRSGDVTGLAALSLSNYFPPEILVSSQNAGSSLLGAGGQAGVMSQLSLRTDNGGILIFGPGLPIPKVEITGGAGGVGQSGGAGGALVGRSDALFADTDTMELTITGGLGGYGMSKGGVGGGVVNVVSLFQGGRPAGDVTFTGGAGGDSASGAGGAGGSLAVRPSPLVNALNGSLSLVAGAGGEGMAGGAGGNIRGFINSPTGNDNPITLRAVAGDGGAGVSGVGGSGGGITDFSVTTSSVGGIAMVAGGRGGLSSAGVGGVGGELRNVAFTSEAGSAVGLAGTGGDGLRGGGSGGAISASRFNAGGLTDARVVVMAGRGGDAFGVSAATVQAENKPAGVSPLYQRLIFALGTTDGLGGNGGAISNFTQPQALKASVDLVAGNGGNTMSYGLISDRKTGVGRGGSMTNINLANDAGLTDANIPIRSYAGDFAQQVLSGLVTNITPQTGNVGVVVGAAGRVRNDLPVSGGVTGSVNGFKAQNIMSMVAGSVDRMVAITSVTGLQLQNGGTIVGAVKNAYVDPNNGVDDAFTPPDSRPFATTYWAPADPTTGIYSFAPGGLSGGALLDGAVLARSYSGPASVRVFKG